MAKFSAFRAALLAKLGRLHRSANGSVYYKPLPTTASLQTKSSEVATVVDHYGRTIVFWLMAFLSVLIFTGANPIAAVIAAAVLTYVYSRLRRSAIARTADLAVKTKAASLCWERIGQTAAENRFFSLLSELLPHLSCRDISYREKRSSGLEITTACRGDNPVLIAFYVPTAGDAMVNKAVADELRQLMDELTPSDTLFFTTAPLGIAAVRRLGCPQASNLTVYDRERLIELCRLSGHSVYPAADSIPAQPMPDGQMPEPTAKELSVAQSLTARKRKLNSRLFTAVLLFLLAAWMRTGLGIRTVYIIFAFYNLVMAAVTFAGWRRDLSLQNGLLSPETEQMAK